MKKVRKIVREILKEVMLKESDGLYIKNFPYGDDLDTIGNISYYIVKSISGDLLAKLQLTDEEMSKVRGFMDDFAADGDGHFKNTGILNFYVRNWPERTHEKIVGYIKWLLSEKDIEVGDITKNTYAEAGWNQEEMKSRGLEGRPEDVRVIRIPIVNNPHNDENKPWEINLSTGTWERIFDMMGMDFREGDDISAYELINKVQTAEALLDYSGVPDDRTLEKLGGGAAGGGVYTVQKNKEDFMNYFDAIKKSAQWALDKGYDTMYIA